MHESRLGPREPGGRPEHATALLPEVERAAAAAGGWEAVGRLAVGVGPGSFTGLRIGISTARALAAALGLPLAGVSTLEALALGIPGPPGRDRLAVLDARRGEAFAALYDGAGRERWEPFVSPPGDLAERLGELSGAPLAAGSGALRFRHELAAGGAEVLAGEDPAHRVSARHVCAAGARAEPGDPDAVRPVYLRQPDAERWRERDH